MSNLYYRQNMLDHSKNPRNFGKIDNPSASAHAINRHCGDEITVFVKEGDGKIEDIKFEGTGCAVSIASASMLTDRIKGKSVEELKNLKERDVLENFGEDLTPSRQKCALLVYQSVREIRDKF